MSLFHSSATQRLEGTQRIEAFSDGVFSIVVTLLILDVKVPHPETFTFPALGVALMPTALQLLTFAFSFMMLCIFWVNHHHFYHQLTHADWPLLWHNIFLLFFLCIVPFTTAFLSKYPTEPLVIAIYAINMCLGVLSFRLMIRHAFFHSNLIPESTPLASRQRSLRRSLFGVMMYAATAAAAFLWVPLAWAGLLIVPVFYFVPRVSKLEE